ncbi:MAG: hypothetical protein ACE5FM_07960 [Methyloligellaceae bacterium]
MRVLLATLAESQRGVTASVRLELYRGNCMVTGRSSPYRLYDDAVASMEDDQGAYDPRDAIGFIKLNALRLRSQAARKRKRKG